MKQSNFKKHRRKRKRRYGNRPKTFEDKLREFMKQSDKKQKEVRKNREKRKGGRPYFIDKKKKFDRSSD